MVALYRVLGTMLTRVAIFITKDGVTLSPDENGIIFSSSYGYDGWTCTDPEDYWQSGWYQGYWSYWLKSSDSDPWGYSGTGITGRKLTDGCWDGWNFSVNMSSQPWKPLAPAPKNGPTAPSVKVQPEDLTVSPGESVTFAPEFKGDSLYFQWYKDEVAIQDAEASSYSIVSAGNFRCRALLLCGEQHARYDFYRYGYARCRR